MPNSSFINRRADTLALTVAVLLAVIVIAAYVMGITNIATELNSAIDPDTGNVQAPTYNLDAAKGLDLKGLSPER
jgi:hypothetical protein